MATAIITFTDHEDGENINVKITFKPEMKNDMHSEKSQAQMHALIALKLLREYAENKQ